MWADPIPDAEWRIEKLRLMLNNPLNPSHHNEFVTAMVKMFVDMVTRLINRLADNELQARTFDWADFHEVGKDTLLQQVAPGDPTERVSRAFDQLVALIDKSGTYAHTRTVEEKERERETSEMRD